MLIHVCTSSHFLCYTSGYMGSVSIHKGFHHLDINTMLDYERIYMRSDLEMGVLVSKAYHDGRVSHN